MNSSNPLLHRLDQLNRIGVGLSRERNINRLLEDILLAAKGITGADGGTLYRMDDSWVLFVFLEQLDPDFNMGALQLMIQALPDIVEKAGPSGDVRVCSKVIG